MSGTRGCLIAGAIGLALGAWGVVRWWPLALTMLKGLLPLVLLLGGVIAIVAGLTPPEVRDVEPPTGRSPHAV